MKPFVSFFKWLSLFIVWFIALGFAASVIFQNHARIEQKINDIHHLIVVEEQMQFFRDCIDSGGVPTKLDGRRICDLVGSLNEPLIDLPTLSKKSCQVSTDCHFPPNIAPLSSCSYQPYCSEDNKCVYGCPPAPHPEDRVSIFDSIELVDFDE